MPIDFYMNPLSSSCQSVLMVARELEIEINNKHMEFGVDTQTPSYKKINFLKTMPAIVDNGFCLSESRAICTYLANKYAPGNPLYPQDPTERAVVDRLLNFDISMFHRSASELLFPIYFKGESPNPEKLEAFKKAVGFLEQFLTQTKYVAGNHLTIADLTIVTTVNASQLIKFDYSEFPKICAWWDRLKAEVSSYDEAIDKPKRDFEASLKAESK